LAESDAPGASVAKVAMAHGVNADIVHGWRKLAGQAGQPITVPALVPVRVEPAAAASSPSALPRIDIERRRGALSLRVAWPLPAAAEPRAWMREVLRSKSGR
jgi:transposase